MDTPAKRYSGINLGNVWRGLNVVPGVITQGERQAAMYMYGGILASGAVVEEEEEAGIGLAPVVRSAPVDFVIQSPLWRQGFVTPRPAPQQTTEASELKEMMQLYAMWKRAA